MAGAFSFVAGVSHLTVEHASLSRRTTHPFRDGSTLLLPLEKPLTCTRSLHYLRGWGGGDGEEI